MPKFLGGAVVLPRSIASRALVRVALIVSLSGISEGGTTGPAFLVKDINPGPDPSYPYETVDVNGTLYLHAGDGNTGVELWRSDGTPAGTGLVKDIRSGPESSGAGLFAAVNRFVVFSADDGVNGVELWRTDGTEGGTRMLMDINPFGDSKPYSLTTTPAGTTVVFSADNGVNGRELWTTDGAEAGTAMLQDIAPGPTSSGAAPTSAEPGLDNAYTISGDSLLSSSLAFFARERVRI